MSEVLFPDGSSLAIKSYPDGMPLIADAREARAVLVRPSSIASFHAFLYWVDSLAARGKPVPHLVLPNVPGARQDRLSDTGDRLFTIRSVASDINHRNFPSVTVVDPHSDVAPALIDRCRVVSAADCIATPPGKYAAVVSPDAGAEKRAGMVARKLGVPLLHAWKSRSVSTGEITGFGMQPHTLTAGSLVLVVDDMCDGGGTFVGLGNVLRESWINAHLWVTHGIFSRGTADLLNRYGHIYCTDSVIGDKPGVIVINKCLQLLSEVEK